MSDTITLSREDLEALIRRVVRQELEARLADPGRSILDDLGHEGPEDPAQDDLLRRDALELIEKYRGLPGARKRLGERRREIAVAEAADELPD